MRDEDLVVGALYIYLATSAFRRGSIFRYEGEEVGLHLFSLVHGQCNYNNFHGEPGAYAIPARVKPFSINNIANREEEVQHDPV